MQPGAKIIADSITEQGHRLTSYELTIHRYILAEMNTHRVFSRSSASSRAIPVSKQIARIQEHPAVPVVFPAEQAGMQGGNELSPELAAEAREVWIEAAEDAVLFAERMVDIGVHKSVTNRLLEPFMWHTVIVTATAYQNFFDLRANPLAQPEFRVVAELMKAAYEASTPSPVALGEWHMPYMDADEASELGRAAPMVSAARCARVSYLTHDGLRDFEKDLDLYKKLITARPMHSAPLEHVATPMPSNEHTVTIDRGTDKTLQLKLPLYGNVIGWNQLRFDVELAQGYQAFS